MSKASTLPVGRDPFAELGLLLRDLVVAEPGQFDVPDDVSADSTTSHPYG